ncbi:ATP-dependent DNA helicase DinG [Neptunomonas japonica]|uniref:ATP-dependent DNA helicase DinG n=1 Tax=Neptunomonas japonica JAMM 1380 TaxID=1441457 RepID=A0A7R6PI55_9GAMM|nr:ATP-dependent DNA helicase DinG [Neptunomonas japonica]BBB29571.1 ATP-dependent DNA helicase DinG [Neptunomonas japonica JAMM 1380]
MLSDALKNSIQASYRRFLADHEMKPRYGQKMMIAHVARTLGAIEVDEKGERVNENHLCVIEAGTGTGKTMAYLLSAIPIAQSHSKSLVISTATVALQEQLLNKDLPEVARLLGESVNYVLAKGRGRYFCISQAEKLLDSQNQTGQIALYEDEIEHSIDPSLLVFYQELLGKFAAGEWDGDRDSLAQEIEAANWAPLTSDHTRCTNRRCSNFSVCPFYKSRDSMDKADIVVANHDLVLADLSLGGGAILPEPANTVYIFDEAHHLSSKATGHFAYTMRVKGTQRWLKSSVKQLDAMLDECDNNAVLAQYVERMAPARQDIDIALDQLHSDLRIMLMDGVQRPASERFRFPKGVLPETMMHSAKDIASAAERWMLKAEQIVDVLKEALDGGVPEINRDVAERWYPRMGLLWMRAQSLYWLNKSYAVADPEGVAPTARWINLVDASDGVDFECRSSPVSAADTLQEHLWSSCFGAVLTSATMTALGHFNRVIHELGLPQDVLCERLPSPFNYPQAAVLSVPRMESDPGKPEEHTKEVISILNKGLASAAATLVLFSSWRQMFTVLEKLESTIRSKVLAQGDLTKNEIIRKHKEIINAEKPSIIFGLASFAEGVDLPGKYLTEVIITKLPFGVPDDPVDATMAEWIEQRGGNAFMEWTVPEASMRLTQATGRLLRTEQDSGRVILLDRRVVTRRYGRQLLDALPPFRREIS